MNRRHAPAASGAAGSTAPAGRVFRTVALIRAGRARRLQSSSRLFYGAVAAFAVVIAVGGTEALAQEGGRSSVERRLHPGRGFFSNDAASRRIGHALDYSRGLQRYGGYVAEPSRPIVVGPGRSVLITPSAVQPRAPQPGVGQSREVRPAPRPDRTAVTPSDELVTTYLREVGRNIAGARERLQEVSADAEAAGDEATQAELKSIGDRLAAAAAEQQKCMEECQSETMDMARIVERCRAITAALEKAKAQHDELMNRLYPADDGLTAPAD
ncbi:hypothetical protein [Alienimonas sp. DA493]|uniref:hypothetical protein n=1 Tax=Alienimonas sp. DA493 TaxID=3373605 RepID=UPI0037543DBC